MVTTFSSTRIPAIAPDGDMADLLEVLVKLDIPQIFGMVPSKAGS